MVRVEVTFIGMDRARAWLARAPERSHELLKEATVSGLEIERRAIENQTPRRSGTLSGSIQKELADKGLETIEGKVFSNLRYAKYVEFGTHKHGRAQHMFRKGAEETEPEVKQIFSNSIHRLTGSF